jgi:hypothetical protein
VRHHWNVCLGLTAIAVPAIAQSPTQPIPRTEFLAVMDQEFRKMDADKDGKLTRAEIEAFQRAAAVAESAQRNRALFSQLDTDRNGQLSPAEFTKLSVSPPTPNAAPVLAQADLNRDQQVTLVEYRTAKLANFDRMDADKDGVVSVAEMRASGLVK